jgi:hemin uptake protein HemP
MTRRDDLPAAPPDAARATDAASVPRYAVADLLQGAREAILDHDGSAYRLRITANGKLILTK